MHLQSQQRPHGAIGQCMGSAGDGGSWIRSHRFHGLPIFAAFLHAASRQLEVSTSCASMASLSGSSGDPAEGVE